MCCLKIEVGGLFTKTSQDCLQGFIKILKDFHWSKSISTEYEVELTEEILRSKSSSCVQVVCV